MKMESGSVNPQHLGQRPRGAHRCIARPVLFIYSFGIAGVGHCPIVEPALYRTRHALGQCPPSQMSILQKSDSIESDQRSANTLNCVQKVREITGYVSNTSCDRI